MKQSDIKTPYYLIDENLIIKNLEILKSVSDKTGAKILLAQKAFSMYSLYPLRGEIFLPVPQQVLCLKLNWATKKCRAQKLIFTLRLTAMKIFLK